jgi:hypothetical protein
MSVLVGPLVSVKPFAPMFERTTPACAVPAAKNAMAIKANAKNLDFIKTNLQKTLLTLQHEARHPGLDVSNLSATNIWSQLLDFPLTGKNQVRYEVFSGKCWLLSNFTQALPVVGIKASNFLSFRSE